MQATIKSIKRNRGTKTALFAGATVLMTLVPQTRAQSSVDLLLDKLEQKGVLSVDEAKQLREQCNDAQTNMVNELPASKWKLSDSIKNIGLYGDLRLRYEYRGVDNPTPGFGSATGASGDTYQRERFRYALRFGLRGDLYDSFNYGIRLETSANPRSPWVTFADDTGKTSATGVPSGTPTDKSSDGLNIGQVYLGWHPTDWYEMTVGKMPMPLYTTPMVWDSDINPEGAFEKFKYSIDNVDLFADFGQFDYQNSNPASAVPSGDTFLTAWQAGANVKFGHDMSFKIAPVVYTYTGVGSSGGLNQNFVGQGGLGFGSGLNTFYNQDAINNLMVLEIPLEFNFKINYTALGTLQARFFGDVAYNLEGDDRARAAFAAGGGNGPNGAFPGLSSAATGQDRAYQVGFGIGSAGPVYGPTQGLVYGSTSKKNIWEARFYWQSVEQYALDVNLMDSDFFEGRANLQGFYTAFAYSFTDAIIGTVRYGYAKPIKDNLGTGGNNLDIPGINPIKNYNLLQMDLTWRF